MNKTIQNTIGILVIICLLFIVVYTLHQITSEPQPGKADTEAPETQELCIQLKLRSLDAATVEQLEPLTQESSAT
jgi:hypothetical protein